MTSLIHELQHEASNPNSSVSDLLRKAKIVAVKLDLDEFHSWIEKELNGYDVQVQDEFPSYRIVHGETKAWNSFYGVWQPIMFPDDKTYRLYSSRGVNQSVGELDNIMKSDSEGTIGMDFGPESKNRIMKAIGLEADIKLIVDRSAIAGILESVRNIILDWSLKIEKAGITGEGMSFSKSDREKAHGKSTIYQINNIENFAGVMGNISGNASIEVTQINESSKEEIRELINQIKKYKSEIDLKSKEESKLDKSIQKLDDILSKAKPVEHSKIHPVLSSIKKIMEAATQNVVTQGINLALEKILGSSGSANT